MRWTLPIAWDVCIIKILTLINSHSADAQRYTPRTRMFRQNLIPVYLKVESMKIRDVCTT